MTYCVANLRLIGLCSTLILSLSCFAKENTIDRQALVERHNPSLSALDPLNPFTLGNGKFAFTADITGLQSFSELYYTKGTPTETKARWAWHSRANPKSYTLKDTEQSYDAYGVKVSFPTNMDEAAGQWLRKNPHDLPLAQIALYLSEKTIQASQVSHIQQTLNLWQGSLKSQYQLDGAPVVLESAVHGHRDALATKIHSSLIKGGQLGISIRFPRAYRLDKKNTPNLEWLLNNEHSTQLIQSGKESAQFLRTIDNSQHYVSLNWKGQAKLKQLGPHHYLLTATPSTRSDLEVTVEFLQNNTNSKNTIHFSDTIKSAKDTWKTYWTQGAVISLEKSTHPKAKELERRIILSQYLMGAQAQATIPTQETGLTSSSWYGKHHTEMTWWHTAHWIYWGRPQQAKTVLAWYTDRLPEAKKLSQSRGLTGARWAKMVDPFGRESPGGNPLIIWNQPQPIHLAEMLYNLEQNPSVLKDYENLVEETAKALSSMLVWEPKHKRFSLLPPIWIAQEIYPATKSKNPSFELSYWRYGLSVAQEWRKRLGKKPNALWEKQLKYLAPLPTKNGKYVAIESIPDTFSNIQSRKDHPTMLAPLGLLSDPTVDKNIMRETLQAVLNTWDWKEKIWGWDYPMISMTALKLEQPDLALSLLLKNAPHNDYLINGHCPQQGAHLPVYLPANGALLSAMAMIVNHQGAKPNTEWNIQAEGFHLPNTNTD